MKLTKTGFFHTQNDGERWWFVTPEGNAFLSFGINHYHAGWWTQDYNREYWNQRFGADETYDPKWEQGFRNVAAKDLERLGINTLGWHTDAPSLTDCPYGAVVPYLRSYKPLVLDHYMQPEPSIYVDVFSDEFEKLCDETARQVAADYVNDPMLLGYCMSDCPILTDDDIQELSGNTSWPRVLRNLGPDAPGKRAYVDSVRKKYETIDAFNAVYESQFSSWEDLLDAKDWRENRPAANSDEKADNMAFLCACVDRYYSVSKACLRKVDPNHLFFGDKLNGNTDNLEQFAEVAAKYVDVLTYQFYGIQAEHEALVDKLTSMVDVPVMNGDTGFSSPSEMMPNPFGPHAQDQAQRAEWLVESVTSCFLNPQFVGWHMCGVIDTWKTMPTKEHYQHQGIMSVVGEFYPEMETAIKQIAGNMYKMAVAK